ncbi:MAG TPA: PBSX family phage terminase large subunit [Bacteroidia bacterium]|nr:PBSX family phage terminase large subunit [Bacteroidia bacterium]
MVFNDKIYSANMSGKRYVIHQGGTGAGKTFSTLQYLLTYAAKYQGSVISIVAETMPHLKRGAMRDMRQIIECEGWDKTIRENKSGFYFKINKSIIEFFPADSAAKLRGARRDVLFINECNNLDYESFQQLDVRTRKRTILDFNPVRRFWVHDKLIPSLQESDFLFLQSTYRDNTSLTAEEIANIERRRSNSNWWKVYGEGEVGSNEGLVFSDWAIVPALKEGESLPGTLLGYGIDFGFTHSPSAIVQVNESNGELYVRELLYKKGMHNDMLFSFAAKHIDLGAKAIADSAEPKTIWYLYQKGWRGLKAAIKGPDSVEHGINLLLERKINVTADSLNLIKELREYMWDTNLAGNFVRKPVKEYDHAIDALRYLYSYPKKRQLLFA